ncbi:hypothetical protein, partial [Roseomonas indoligenes]|uniref:hypothetical protein n=1 Tax=Roseomonas indoligenes TaxID=2820811 RepID=UPI001FD86F40
MQCVFRLYGNFALQAPGRDGVVEVWLDGLRTMLRWLPRASVDTSEDPAPASIPPGSSAAAFFTKNADTDCAAWIDDIAKAGGIVLKGASLIEQYCGDVVDLRLPLANGVVYGNPLKAGERKTTPTFSGLRVFTWKGAPRFGLHLHFPSPVEQALRSNARAFPITAEYLANPLRADVAPPIIATLRGGWSKDNGSGGTSIPLDMTRIAQTERRLGGFGFSERGKNSDTGFVIYTQATSQIGDYWPSNAETFLLDLCRRYGFAVGGTASWLTFSHNSPADLSLRFDGEPRTRLIYRVRTKRHDQASPQDGADFRFDSGGRLEIRLAAELGGAVVAHDSGKTGTVGGWLALAKVVSADCTLGWTISQHAAWSGDRSTDWSPTVTIRMHWAEQVDTITASPVTPGQRFNGGLLAFAANSFETTRDALPAGEAGNPVSFLPSLALANGQAVRFVLHGTPIPATMDQRSGLVEWGCLDAEGRPLPWRRPPMRLTLARSDDLIASTPEAKDGQTLSVVATNISFFD